MDTLLRSLCSVHWAAKATCVVVFVGYYAVTLYVSWSSTQIVDLSGIEKRLDRIEAKQDEMSKLLQLPQVVQLSPEREAALADAYRHMAAVFDEYQLLQKLQGPPGF